MNDILRIWNDIAYLKFTPINSQKYAIKYGQVKYLTTDYSSGWQPQDPEWNPIEQHVAHVTLNSGVPALSFTPNLVIWLRFLSLRLRSAKNLSS